MVREDSAYGDMIAYKDKYSSRWLERMDYMDGWYDCMGTYWISDKYKWMDDRDTFDN